MHPPSVDLKKFLFLVPFLCGAVALILAGGWAVYVGHVVTGVGSLLTGSTVALFFLVMLRSRIARYSPMLPWQNISAIGGLLVVLFGMQQGERAPATIAVATAVIALLGMPLYTFWYARLPKPEPDGIVVGQPFPDVELRTLEGASWTSAMLQGHKSFLLFFRGNWCPLCMAQIREVAALYQEIEAKGAQVLLVSGQSERDSQRLAARFDVRFVHLVDPELKAAKSLGLFHGKAAALGLGILFPTARQADAYLPVIVFVDEDGVVQERVLTDNYLVRPEPETFLEILKAHS